MRRDNFRTKLEPNTSWGTSWQIRHITSVTRSPTGLPQMITYYVTFPRGGGGFVSRCNQSTFQDWAWCHGGENTEVKFQGPSEMERVFGEMSANMKDMGLF